MALLPAPLAADVAASVYLPMFRALPLLRSLSTEVQMERWFDMWHSLITSHYVQHRVSTHCKNHNNNVDRVSTVDFKKIGSFSAHLIHTLWLAISLPLSCAGLASPGRRARAASLRGRLAYHRTWRRYGVITRSYLLVAVVSRRNERMRTRLTMRLVFVFCVPCVWFDVCLCPDYFAPIIRPHA